MKHTPSKCCLLLTGFFFPYHHRHHQYWAVCFVWRHFELFWASHLRESKVKGAHFPWQSLVRPFSVARRGVPERQQCDTMRIAAEAYHSALLKKSTHCLSGESTESAGEDNHALIDHFIYIGWRARQSNLSSHSRQLSPWNAVTALKNDFLSFSPLLHSTCPAHYHCFLCRCSLTASHFICLHWIFTSGVTVILLFW